MFKYVVIGLVGVIMHNFCEKQFLQLLAEVFAEFAQSSCRRHHNKILKITALCRRAEMPRHLRKELLLALFVRVNARLDGVPYGAN